MTQDKFQEAQSSPVWACVGRPGQLGLVSPAGQDPALHTPQALALSLSLPPCRQAITPLAPLGSASADTPAFMQLLQKQVLEVTSHLMAEST